MEKVNHSDASAAAAASGVGSAAAANAGNTGSDPAIDRPAMKYPHNPIDAFSNGCLMDLRARLAVNFLEHSPAMEVVARATMEAVGKGEVTAESAPAWVSRFALSMAEALMEECEKKGYVAPLPAYTELEPILLQHAKRTGAFGFMQQVGGGEQQTAYAKVQAANQPRVAVANPGSIPPAPGRH